MTATEMTRVERNLQEMERVRERYWLGHPGTSPTKLRWRALTVRHCFHVLPGERVLELGAGSGLWTEHLTDVLRGENPITAAVFNEDLARQLRARNLRNITVELVESLDAFPSAHFDYVVGTAILCHDEYPRTLRALQRVLKPGGQLLFFEPNFWNPQVLLKSIVPGLGRALGQARCQSGLRRWRLMYAASQQGFTQVDIVPYDILHPATPRSLIRFVQALAFVLEHAPVVREICGTLYIWARKPGRKDNSRPLCNLATHRSLIRSTSFVIPCHNEEMNIEPLVRSILQLYGPYVREILLVNDNSRDRTADVVRAVAAREPRVRLVDRSPPNGVGRALRDGYAAARGRYILSMDCDFVQILPEMRDMFDAIAAGHDGAIGSRFSHESVLLNYPFLKILSNRCFHVLANLLLPRRFRDISNNLKLYRADILRSLDIESDHFAANVETGLKPLLAGHDIREVPVSWINRTIDMGSSSFRVLRVAPEYARTLGRIVASAWRIRGARSASPSPAPVLPTRTTMSGTTGDAEPVRRVPSLPMVERARVAAAPSDHRE